MGIMSVPNRIDFKRNQINDSNYQAYIGDLEKLAQATSFSLKELDEQLEKPSVTETVAETNSATTDNAPPVNVNTENDGFNNKTDLLTNNNTK